VNPSFHARQTWVLRQTVISLVTEWSSTGPDDRGKVCGFKKRDRSGAVRSGREGNLSIVIAMPYRYVLLFRARKGVEEKALRLRVWIEGFSESDRSSKLTLKNSNGSPPVAVGSLFLLLLLSKRTVFDSEMRTVGSIDSHARPRAVASRPFLQRLGSRLFSAVIGHSQKGFVLAVVPRNEARAEYESSKCSGWIRVASLASFFMTLSKKSGGVPRFTRFFPVSDSSRRCQKSWSSSTFHQVLSGLGFFATRLASQGPMFSAQLISNVAACRQSRMQPCSCPAPHISIFSLPLSHNAIPITNLGVLFLPLAPNAERSKPTTRFGFLFEPFIKKHQLAHAKRPFLSRFGHGEFSFSAKNVPTTDRHAGIADRQRPRLLALRIFFSFSFPLSFPVSCFCQVFAGFSPRGSYQTLRMRARGRTSGK
jgi:hypothetical protein